ncbi:hypothetical protein MKW94_004867 [Papaver nudicaule]|uniref:F-box domain-containing protein n=1 Tax=Papaver nudicaule TaxID=74823 RepID=A0AA41VN99_PAPNU|nr:hypothetical protein [Papaver nudicaule]
MDGDPLNSLPQDLLIEILLWLPVASLLRSKAVCKLWRSIIQSSDFIRRHATFENSSSKLGDFIFQYRPSHIKDFNYKPYFLLLSSSSREEDYDQWSYKNLGISPHLSDGDDGDDEYDWFSCYPPEASMVGSCHGIICVHDPEPRDIILWNPATKKFRCIPKSLPLLDEFGELQTEFVFFGFDCQTHDYKVVQITFFKIDNEVDITPRNRVQIYSLRSDSWRWCMDANLYGHSHRGSANNQGRYLHGSYYFWGHYFRRNELSYVKQDAVVLSFNFSTESFRMMPGPCGYFDLDAIGGDRGKIVCISTDLSSRTDVHEVYALNDYDYSCNAANADKKEYSWTKLHTFTINHAYGGFGIKAVTKNGECGFLLRRGGGLLVINFLTEEMQDVETIDASVGMVLRADVYKESLVSIDSAVSAQQ